MLTDYSKFHVAGAGYTELRPDSVSAAVRDWRAALAQGATLRVRGSGHGLSGATVPRSGETLVRTRGLDHYRVEAPRLLTAGSGAVLWDVRDFASDRGLRLPICNGGWAGPTVVGFVCAGGLGLRLPPSERVKLAANEAVAEEDAVWKVVGDWSSEHRDALRPTGGWVGPLQDGAPIGFRYLVRRLAPTPPMLYPRDEDFVTLGVMAVCGGIGTDAAEAALTRAERVQNPLR